MSDGPSPPLAQPTTETTFTVYAGPPLETIRQIVASQFQLKDAFLDPNGVPTILVAAEPAKEKFKAILQQLFSHELIAAIRGSGDNLIIKVFQKPHLRPSRRKINLILFLATIATLSLAGYFLWTGSFVGYSTLSAQYDNIVAPGASPYLEGAAFALGLLAIIGLHEFGHKAAANHHKMDSTLPYFIPGPPPIGTFGALISLRSPPTNRDQLFDLGLSGPVVGFIVTIAVSALSIFWGVLLPQPQVDQLNALFVSCGSACTPPTGSQPLILSLICGVSSTCSAPNFVQNQQLAFAAQIGALLTFLNIIPAWQLDGGHISRAVFGPDGHRIASVLGLLILLIAQYYAFFILILVMSTLTRRGLSGVEPLDDISPVSNSRKIAYLLGIGMLVLTFAFSPFRY